MSNLTIKKSETTTVVRLSNPLHLLLLIAAAAHKGPSPSYYQPKSYWKMDAQESIFRNSGAAIFGRDKTDILYQK